jgi:hypothetical protein
MELLLFGVKGDNSEDSEAEDSEDPFSVSELAASIFPTTAMFYNNSSRKAEYGVADLPRKLKRTTRAILILDTKVNDCDVPGCGSFLRVIV